jgi:ribonuclease D
LRLGSFNLFHASLGSNAKLDGSASRSISSSSQPPRPVRFNFSSKRGKNLPRGRIVKDDTLGEIAVHPPKSQDDLGKIRGLSAGWKSNDIGARLMAALETAEPLSNEEMPQREANRPGLTKDGALVSDLLKLLLKIRAKESGVAPKLIARSSELEALAAGVRKDLKILGGWRFEEFGRDALDLVEGRLAFAIENGKLKMSRIASGPPEQESASDS